MKEINIQVMNRCTLQCVFCARNWIDPCTLIKIKKRYMDNETFQKVINKCVDYNIDTFCLTPTMGDPFMDSNFLKKLNYLEHNKKVKRYFFSTNFIILNEQMIKTLLSYKKLGLQISIYGYDEESFERITQMKGWTRFLENLKILFLNASKRNCTLEMCIRFPFEWDYIKTLPVGKILKIMRDTYGIKVNDKEQLNFNLGGLIGYNDLIEMHGPHEKKGVCPTAEMGCIYENGDMGLCYMNDIYREYNFGNIFKEGLDKLYEQTGWIRLGQAEGIYKKCCKDCDENWSIYE